MRTSAVIMDKPGSIGLANCDLTPPSAADAVVEVSRSAVSTGTEKLLWTGAMPDFPGMGYPLVPGYEAIGTVVEAGAASGVAVGARVFVPGATCFVGARALFGAAARTLVVPATRLVANDLGDERGLLLALAATAHHALGDGAPPELIVGHGVVGRLLARIAVARGAPPPTVWEAAAERRAGDFAYPVLSPDADPRRDYRVICDCSGDPAILDGLVARLARGGEIVLAGFYADPLFFAFPPAFLREMRLRVAAQWAPGDMAAVCALVASGRLSLDGLLTDVMPAREAPAAYARAFAGRDCLKMVLDWSDL